MKLTKEEKQLLHKLRSFLQENKLLICAKDFQLSSEDGKNLLKLDMIVTNRDDNNNDKLELVLWEDTKSKPISVKIPFFITHLCKGKISIKEHPTSIRSSLFSKGK
jgi:hypothetical protein